MSSRNWLVSLSIILIVSSLPVTRASQNSSAAHGIDVSLPSSCSRAIIVLGSVGGESSFPAREVIAVRFVVCYAISNLRRAVLVMPLRQGGSRLSVFCTQVLHQVSTRTPPSLNVSRPGVIKRCLQVPRKSRVSPPTAGELSALYRERLGEFRSERCGPFSLKCVLIKCANLTAHHESQHIAPSNLLCCYNAVYIIHTKVTMPIHNVLINVRGCT